MTSMSLIEKIAIGIIQSIIYETKHGHVLDKETNKYVSIKDFFLNKVYLDTCDWTWGLTKDEREFVKEYYDYFKEIKK